MNGNFSSKRVLITGGGCEKTSGSLQRGIGAELAIQFSQLGAEVITVILNSKKDSKLSNEMYQFWI